MAALAEAEKPRRSRTAGELLADLTGAPRPEPPTARERLIREPVEFIGSDGDPRPPHVRLRHNLELARQRSVPFHTAWHTALHDALLGIGEKRERVMWQAAFTATRREWEAAFHRVGPRLFVFDRLFVDDD